jgi:hypothetical protein
MADEVEELAVALCEELQTFFLKKSFGLWQPRAVLKTARHRLMMMRESEREATARGRGLFGVIIMKWAQHDGAPIMPGTPAPVLGLLTGTSTGTTTR